MRSFFCRRLVLLDSSVGEKDGSREVELFVTHTDPHWQISWCNAEVEAALDRKLGSDPPSRDSVASIEISAAALHPGGVPQADNPDLNADTLSKLAGNGAAAGAGGENIKGAYVAGGAIQNGGFPGKKGPLGGNPKGKGWGKGFGGGVGKKGVSSKASTKTSESGSIILSRPDDIKWMEEMLEVYQLMMSLF